MGISYLWQAGTAVPLVPTVLWCIEKMAMDYSGPSQSCKGLIQTIRDNHGPLQFTIDRHRPLWTAIDDHSLPWTITDHHSSPPDYRGPPWTTTVHHRTSWTTERTMCCHKLPRTTIIHHRPS